MTGVQTCALPISITPLGVLEVLLWDVLLSPSWECIWLEVGPLELSSADIVGR